MSTRVRRRVAAIVTAAAVATAGVVVLTAGGAVAGGAPAYTTVRVKAECQLARVDLTNGDVTPLGEPPAEGACVTDLTVAPDGAVYGLIEEQVEPKALPLLRATLVEFNPDSGAIVSSELLTGDFTESTIIRGAGLAFAPDGVLYAFMATDELTATAGPVCGSDKCLYRVDPATRLAELVGPSGLVDALAFFLAVSCDGDAVSSVLVGGTPTPFATDGAAEGPVDEGSVDDQEVVAGGPKALASVSLSSGDFTPGPEFDVPDEGLAVYGFDFEHPGNALYALIGPGFAREEQSVGPMATGFAVATIDRATGLVTQVAPITDPALEVATLGIGGTCVSEVPAPGVAPIVIQPTFTG